MFCIFNWALVVYGYIFIKEVRHSLLDSVRDMPSNMIYTDKGQVTRGYGEAFQLQGNPDRSRGCRSSDAESESS